MSGSQLDWTQIDKRKMYTYMPILGLAVRVPIYPATLIKTRMQSGMYGELSLVGAATQIVKSEGVLALYRGFGVSLVGLAVGPVYITALEASKSTLRKLNESYRVVGDNSMAISMLGGALGSVAGQCVAVPLDVVSQRLQVAGGQGSALQTIRALGPLGLYRGFFVSLSQYVPSSAVTWGTFDVVLRTLRPLEVATRPDGSAAGWARDAGLCGISGGVAGAVTGVVTCPLDVVRTRMQVLGDPGSAAPTVRSVVRGILAEYGPIGFFTGVSARVATLAPLMTCIMSGYEVLKRVCAIEPVD